MHNDLIGHICEFHYRDHEVLIVQRQIGSKPPFLWFYVFDLEEVMVGGTNFVHFSEVKEDDLNSLIIAEQKIKVCIDKMLSSRETGEQEKEQKKKYLNWKGRIFKRGDCVHFKGNKEYKATDTYVWSHCCNMTMDCYIIEHEDGIDRENFLAPEHEEDGFELVHPSELNEGLKYIAVHCHPDFEFETDELEILKPIS